MFRVVEFFMLGDVIGPIAWLVRNLFTGPTHTFGVPMGCGWSGRDVSALLGEYDIGAWGNLTINRVYIVTVRQHQAADAQDILDWAGVQVTTRRVFP